MAVLAMAPSLAAEPQDKPLAGVVQAVIEASANLDGVPFPDVIFASTGCRILPVRPESHHDQLLLEMLASVMNSTLDSLNGPDSPAIRAARINEASQFFESVIAETINSLPDWRCRRPHTSAGRTQTAGYPDLEILHLPTNSLTYLDPKVFAAGTESSSLRTFYFEPQNETSKVTSDARHLLVGIAHEEQEGRRAFVSWQIIDLTHLSVRLKAEFQASNRDMYAIPPLIRSGR